MAIAVVRPRADGSTVDVVISDRSDGDLQIDQPADQLAMRRAVLMAGDWAVVRQVHGTTVVDADPNNTPEADAIVTTAPDQPIAAHGADCAPIAFVTDRGPIGVAHVGWRGLISGVVGETVERLRAGGASGIEAIVGPVIGAECYEFSPADLTLAADALGPSIRATTIAGKPSLDMRAGIREALRRVDVEAVEFAAGCTACTESGFSHRARADAGRHAVVARIREKA